MLKRWLICVVLSLMLSPLAHGQRAVYLVRHAERPPQGDELTIHGKEQADQLARLLEQAGITMVVTSQFERTKQTAAKLTATLLAKGIDVRTKVAGLPQTLLDHPEDPIALANYANSVVSTIKTAAPNEVILVVGHDLTVPAIIRAFGYKSELTINSDEYERLFVLVPRSDLPPGFLHIPKYTVLTANSPGPNP